MNVHLHGEQRPGRKPRSAAAIHFYTQCRTWHGYLSALAFLILMFFSVTGIVLNHPEWLGAPPEPQSISADIPLEKVTAASKDAAALGALAAAEMNLPGVYSSGDVDSREALLRYEGVKGMATVTLDMRSGRAVAEIQRADTLTVLNDLHRGKNAGATWKAIIDISGIVILILSVIGYVLFFSMRFRLRTALALTVVSLAGLAGIFAFLVP